MQYRVLASGSSGNAVLVEGNILIDCGVTYKTLQPFLRSIEIVLLTHIHSDHFKKSTIKKLAKERPKLRFACGSWLRDKLVDCGVSPGNIDVLSMNKMYNYGSFKVSPFILYHDVDQCGWRVFTRNQKLFYATDTKTLEGIEAKNYDVYLVEANYEEDELKERIQKKQENGEFCYEFTVPDRHLSKKQADDFLFAQMGDKSCYRYMHQHMGD